MKKLLLFFVIVNFIFSCSILPSFARKKKFIVPKMVETKEEWLEKSTSVPLDERDFKPVEIETNKKLNEVKPPNAYIVKYNMPPGKEEANISEIKKQHTMHAKKVASPDFEKAVITYYYFSPSHNQISSELFIIPLETNKTKTKRLIEALVIDKNKGSSLTSGVYEFRDNFFKTLTLVDWSFDSKKILVKEKIGSANSGVFRTNLIVGKLEKDEWKYTKYTKLNDEIIKFNEKKNGLLLNNFRWDIRILGFALDENNLAIVEAILWDKNGNEKFLNLWGIDTENGKIKYISSERKPITIQTNGYSLEFSYE